MTQAGADTRYLLDRAAIHDVLARYFQAVDQCDAQGVRGCFTGDALAVYAGRPPVRGADALVASLAHHFEKLRSGELKASTHFMGNLNYQRIDGDSAETETYAIAFVVRAAQGQPDRIAVRGLRYLDRLRREANGWRICERRHTLDWSCEESATFSLLLAQRLMRLPAEASAG